jgi:ubiquinone/menaquinone biosynthesis C-methylase UbiE
MARGESERSTIEEFDLSYSKVTSPALLSVERTVCGCDYGGTSWTTRVEADRIGRELGLMPGKTLLEVGAGAGWPALYLAKSLGCSAVLVDLPPEGLRVAAERIRADGLLDLCRVIQGDGAALPVEDGRFDAISHSDVLCCLPNKTGVLRECRRAIKETGRMAFTVIYVPQGLSDEDHAVAVEAGPPFVEAETTYEAMLAESSWRIAARVDVTDTFQESMRKMIDARLAHADALIELIGQREHEDFLARMRQKMPAIERRVLERALFVAEPM